MHGALGIHRRSALVGTSVRVTLVARRNVVRAGHAVRRGLREETFCCHAQAMAGVSIQRSSPFRVSTSWDSVFRGVREGVDSGGRPARLPERKFSRWRCFFTST